MPTPRRLFTLAETDTIRTLRGEGWSLDRICAAIGGCARDTLAAHMRKVGIPMTALGGVGPKPQTFATIDREPLPAGHPVSWGAICVGTCIEGQEFGA